LATKLTTSNQKGILDNTDIIGGTPGKTTSLVIVMGSRRESERIAS
jgi:mannose/fructose-specific phosphotransferase system component IIA